MFYLLYGNDLYSRKQQLEKIKKEYSFSDLDIRFYNFLDVTMKDILEDATTFPLFSNKKMIIVENVSLFSTTAKSSDDTLKLENYLQNPNPDTILVFVTEEEKLDTRKKIVKQLIENKRTMECKKPSNSLLFVKDLLKDYQVSSKTITNLIDRVGEDITLLANEVEKLKLYKIDSKVIEEQDLEIVTKNIDTNLFKFIDEIIAKNSYKTLEIYHELMSRGEEAIAIVIMIAGQVRLLYQVKELLLLGKTEKEIAEFLEIHPYRVKLAHEKSARYNSSTLLHLLEQLADLDYQMKSGEIEPAIGLELFLLAN